MRPARRTGPVVALAALAALVLATACSTLPVDGDVHTQPDRAVLGAGEAPYFVPPGPVAGADRESIVRGFLLATQANPPGTSVARSYLSEHARNTWKPTGTLVYDSSVLETDADGVLARLTAAHRLDERGSWLGDTAATSMKLAFNLILEDGEWRIANPPRALLVPTSYFGSLYVPFLLYFFDRTGSVLVPSRVYLPLGQQVASSLVRGLLAGPTAANQEASTTAFGRSGIDLDLSVVVSDDGVAEIPLSAKVQRLSPADLYQAVVQLAATLRQLPGVLRFRITVDGIPIPLVNGQTDVNVEVAPEFDPTAAAGRQAVAVIGERVVHDDESGTAAVGGPFGRHGFALRSVAESISGRSIAGVAENGRRAYQAPSDGSTKATQVQTVVDGATNLLRPAYDRFGGLWLVDETRNGAVVHLVDGGADRVVKVRGISGRKITAITVTRDGTGLVAALANESAPTVMVSSLVRSETGQLVRARPARKVVVDGADAAPIVDIGQDSATTVAVLTQSASGSGRIFVAELDGSPGRPQESLADPVPGELVSLLTSPDPRLPMRVLTAEGRILTLTSSGEWVRTASAVLAAAYPQ